MDRYARVVVVALAVGVGAAGAAEPKDKTKAETPREFTLGLVQREIRPGLFQADVAERLGSPNIVTRGPDGREAWVYDRVSTEFEYSSGQFGLGGLGSGAGSTFGGILGLAAGKRSEKGRTTQRSLTVVIRFSAAGAIESFTWHDSRF